LISPRSQRLQWFKRTRGAGDKLRAAIELIFAIEVISENLSDRESTLHNIESRLMQQYKRMEEAIWATRRMVDSIQGNHVNREIRLLGMTLRMVEQIRMIICLEHVVDSTPDGHPDRSYT